MSANPAIGAGMELADPAAAAVQDERGREGRCGAHPDRRLRESPGVSGTAERWPDGCGPSAGACEISRTHPLGLPQRIRAGSSARRTTQYGAMSGKAVASSGNQRGGPVDGPVRACPMSCGGCAVSR
jgi:hypothetical protein